MTRSESARLNGAKSKGPVTPEGKAISSRNALKHGLSQQIANHVTIRGEKDADFDAFRDSYFQRFQPADQAESDLVDTLAMAQWRIRRARCLEAYTFADAFDCYQEALAQAFTSTPSNNQALAYVFERLNLDANTHAPVMRYEAQISRLYDRALKQLLLLQKNRPASPENDAPDNDPPALALVKLPNEPKPDPDQPPQHPKIVPLPAPQPPKSPADPQRNDD